MTVVEPTAEPSASADAPAVETRGLTKVYPGQLFLDEPAS